MKWMGFHVVWLLLLTATFCFAAEQASRSAPEPVSVDYLANEAYAPDKGYVVVRSAFEVQGPAHRWIALDVEFRLTQAVPLVQPDGKAFMKRWNDLFLPETPDPTRWTDCRLDVDYREIEKAQNLPKDKTFVVWAMGLIFDHAVGKHVGSGWAVRTPLLLTTDASGRIQNASTPTFAPIRFQYPSDKTIDARRADIRTQHLKPLPGLRAYRVVRRDAKPVTVLAGPKGQIWKPRGFGGAFGPIDSADKAEEFVRLMHPGAMIVKTRRQYDAVIGAARQLGWRAENLPKTAPTFPHPRVTPVEGLGWRVEALLIEPGENHLGDMAAWDYCIATDGRCSVKHDVLLHAPGGKEKTPASAKAYTDAVRSALEKLSPEIISPRILPTDAAAKLPLPAEHAAEQFVSPADVSFTAPATQPAEPSTTRPPDPTVETNTITTHGPTPIRRPQ